ncbi:MAG: zinc ribbon domain-containing protein [Bacteroidota bacterium]
MECPNCKTNNEGSKRFCTSCGASLGAICKRCGKLGKAEDKYCGECGTALAVSSNEHLFSHPNEPAAVKQYALDEIEELLSLRKIAREEEAASERMTQQDIDSIFT